YRVYLQTYNDGRYTGYQVHDDIVVMDVMYEYQGEIFHVGYNDIGMGGSFGGSGGNGSGGLGGSEDNGFKIDFSGFQDWFLKLPQWIQILGAVAAAVIVIPWIRSFFKNIKKITSNPREMLLWIAVIGVILYLLGIF